jgi:hypothetical protein
MEYQELANKYATQFGIDPELYSRVINQESRWNPNAVSPAGARGIAQIMPATAADPGFGVSPVQLGNTEDELRFGAEYLSSMIGRYDGDVNKGLAAYNWGAGNVDDWQGDLNSLPEETRNYINTIAGDGFQFAPSGGGGDQQPPITTTELDTGFTPLGDITRRAEAGIGRSEESAAVQGMNQRDLAGPQNATDPSSARDVAVGALTQGDPEDPENMSLSDRIMAKMFPRLDQEGRQDALLAIGTGLLSGDDWSEGIANSAENLLGMRVQQRGAERASGSGQTYNRPFNVVGRDPETGMEVVRSGTLIGGVPHVMDASGNQVPAESMLRDVRIGGRSENQDVTDGAGGIPNASYVSDSGIPVFQFQREGEQKNYGYAIRAIGAYKDMGSMLESAPIEDVTSLRSGLERWAASNANASVTGAVLNDIIDSAGIQGQFAATSRAFLQAVLRADTGAAYTGTEIADYASVFLPAPGDNPEEVAQKRVLMERELMRFAGTTGSAAPYLGGLIDGKYDLPGGYWQSPSPTPSPTTGGGSNIDSILQGYGI